MQTIGKSRLRPRERERESFEKEIGELYKHEKGGCYILRECLLKKE